MMGTVVNDVTACAPTFGAPEACVKTVEKLLTGSCVPGAILLSEGASLGGMPASGCRRR